MTYTNEMRGASWPLDFIPAPSEPLVGSFFPCIQGTMSSDLSHQFIGFTLKAHVWLKDSFLSVINLCKRFHSWPLVSLLVVVSFTITSNNPSAIHIYVFDLCFTDVIVYSLCPWQIHVPAYNLQEKFNKSMTSFCPANYLQEKFNKFMTSLCSTKNKSTIVFIQVQEGVGDGNSCHRKNLFQFLKSTKTEKNCPITLVST